MNGHSLLYYFSSLFSLWAFCNAECNTSLLATFFKLQFFKVKCSTNKNYVLIESFLPYFTRLVFWYFSDLTFTGCIAFKKHFMARWLSVTT